MPQKRSPNFFVRIDAHYRLYFAIGVTAVIFFIFLRPLELPTLILLTWSTFALSVIITEAFLIFDSHPREVAKISKIQDSSRSIIFLFVVGASIASLGAILFLLKSSKEASQADITGHVLLSMAAVIVSWWLVHTIFSMHYAHLYYSTKVDNGKTKVAGGLNFPDEPEPDYLDFVYFSFVLGTTFQVSDVEISSRHIRRLALVHGLISFVFNTAILALSINIVSGFVSK